MELSESNLQLMLSYRLARFNPQRGYSWGVSLDWFTSRLHQGFPGSKIWEHISKAWKVMVKGVYRIPPCTCMELLHYNIWWLDKVELLNKGFTYSKALHLYRKGIQYVDDIWDNTQQNFLTQEKAQKKSSLINTELEDWEELINKISGQWRHLLDTDKDTAGRYYVNGEENPAFVFQCDSDFTPECLQWHNLMLPLPVQCFTVGTHSRYLRVRMPPWGVEGLLSQGENYSH